jgi:serine/threonine protein kinase
MSPPANNYSSTAHSTRCWDLLSLLIIDDKIWGSPAGLKVIQQLLPLYWSLLHSLSSSHQPCCLPRTPSDPALQEYMAGGTLKSLVTRQMLASGGSVYTHCQALDICLQMARGLRYLHRSNPMVIHRDLKLENVLLKRACSICASLLPSASLPSLHAHVALHARFTVCLLPSPALPAGQHEWPRPSVLGMWAIGIQYPQSLPR